MAGRGNPLDRGLDHVARAVADAPVWAGATLLLIAPLAASEDFNGFRAVGLSAGLAVLGGAILARRMAPDGAPMQGAASEAGRGRPAIVSSRRGLAACVSVLLCLPAILLGAKEDVAETIGTGAPAVAGALCGAMPHLACVVPVVAVGAFLGTRGIREQWFFRGAPVGAPGGSGLSLFHSSTDGEAVARVAAVSAMLAAVARGWVRTVLWVALGIAGVVVVAKAVSINDTIHGYGPTLLVPADVLIAAALAAVAGSLAERGPSGDGFVVLRRHPWITAACVLAGASVAATALVVGMRGWDVQDSVIAGTLLLSVAMAAALGNVRSGDFLSRIPAVLGLQPLVAGLLLYGRPWSVLTYDDPKLAPAIVVLGAACIVAFVPFRAPTGVIPAACGLFAHVWVAIGFSVRGHVADSLVLGALGLPFAAILTPWDARMATLGVAVAWAGAGCLPVPGRTASPFESALVGLAFGFACHLANRLRAITPIPADHPVFTEGPHVTAARSLVRDGPVLARPSQR